MEQKFWTSVNEQDTGCVNCSYLLHKCNALYSSIMLFLISFQILMLYICGHVVGNFTNENSVQ